MLSQQPVKLNKQQSAEANPDTHRLRDFAVVAACALSLRLLFAALTSNTYDYDEFVVLLLSRDFAHGAVPYRDFMFFHPPGSLLFFGALQPLTSLWWPAARLLVAVLDSVTCGLVCFIGSRTFGRREGIIAGLLYACSPLAIISGVRVGEDSLVTALGVAGLAVLVGLPSRRAAFVAGSFVGLAVWTKLPALVLVPVYLLASPRRAVQCLAGMAAAMLIAFLPFLNNAHDLYYQTVTFQRTRWLMPADQRLETTALYWLAVNPLAPIAAIIIRRPVWLVAGFSLGLLFVFPSQVYYHYFVPIAPFGALLAAPLLVRLSRVSTVSLGIVGLVLALVWAAVIDFGGPSPLFVTAAHLSDVAPAVNLLTKNTRPGDAILADRYEYAYLADRQALAHYFWNIGTLVDAAYLERRVNDARAVVLSRGASSGYPAGFVPYLDGHFRALRTASNRIWLIHGSSR